MNDEHPSLSLIRQLEARHKWERDALRAEIERLTAENDVLHKTDKWRYENVLLMKAEIRRLTAKNTDAAAFLDGIANVLWINWPQTSADCRAMAAKLRATSYDAEMERQHGPDLIRER